MKNIYGDTNLIIWQKWFDPFGEDDTEHKPSIDLDHNEDQYEDEDDDNNHSEPSYAYSKKPLKAIATPMGLIPYTENTASSKIFNFWVGHSNFDLTSEIVDVIENTEGTETLDVFSRYRFRIAIGKAFDDAKVMKSINDRVYHHIGLSNGNEFVE
jgi:hypothetical protein